MGLKIRLHQTDTLEQGIVQCKSINTTRVVLTQKARQSESRKFLHITALNNYYWFLLSIKVLRFVGKALYLAKLELLFHLFPFLLCQSFVYRGYKHQKASIDDTLHAPSP